MKRKKKSGKVAEGRIRCKVSKSKEETTGRGREDRDDSTGAGEELYREGREVRHGSAGQRKQRRRGKGRVMGEFPGREVREGREWHGRVRQGRRG